MLGCNSGGFTGRHGVDHVPLLIFIEHPSAAMNIAQEIAATTTLRGARLFDKGTRIETRSIFSISNPFRRNGIEFESFGFGIEIVAEPSNPRAGHFTSQREGHFAGIIPKGLPFAAKFHARSFVSESPKSGER